MLTSDMNHEARSKKLGRDFFARCQQRSWFAIMASVLMSVAIDDEALTLEIGFMVELRFLRMPT